MTLELESYYQNLMATKGRSASICAPGCSAMEAAALHRRHPPTTTSSRGENGQSSRALLLNDDYSTSRGSGGNMQISSSTPTRPRKHGAHRSQSARVVGSRPKIKRREQDLIKDYQQQQHLDLASSEGALRDCQESYNPFIRKVPSAGRLITSTSLEMSNNSLHGTPPPPSQPSHHPHHVLHNANHYDYHHGTPPMSDTPRDSPKFVRRHSGGGPERRGSADQKCTPEKDCYSFSGGPGSSGVGIIPTIATPESSPLPSRRPTKPTGLPKSPQPTRSNSARRVNSVKSPRKPTGYLDVPDRDNNPPDVDDEDEESYRLRSFSVTPKGIVNRGDSFRRRRSRSNSLIPTPTTPEPHRNAVFTSEDGLLLPKSVSNEFSASSRGSSPNVSRRSSYRPSPQQPLSPTEPEVTVNHRVAMIGARGVGKSALVSQFLTSESINAYDRQNEVEGEETVTVMLNGEESEMTFFKMQNPKTDCNRLNPPDAFVLVYSVVDRASFVKVETELRRLQEWDILRTKAVVVVANKIDLARSRAVSTQDGRCLAVSYRVKFTEVSVGINHNVDELLVGLLHQIRLKSAQSGNQESWCKHRGIVRASVKARQMLTWLLGKEDAKFKNCENLHIL